MDQLKAKIHFILFGVFVLIGLALAGYGITLKSAEAEEVAAAGADLKKGGLASQGDLAEAEQQKTAFDGSFKEIRDYLKGPGAALPVEPQEKYSTVQEFYSRVAQQELDELKVRFEAISDRKFRSWWASEGKDPSDEQEARKKFKLQGLPAAFQGHDLKRYTRNEDYWGEAQAAMKEANSGEDIPLMLAQLRVMKEVAFVCEELVKLDQHRDGAFQLVKFDFNSFRAEFGRGNDEPWARYQFAIQLKCEAAFASALVGELCDPSGLTARENPARVPMELVDYRYGVLPRPASTKFIIKNKDRAAHGIPKDLSSTSDDDAVKWIRIRKDIAKGLQKSVIYHRPLEVGILINALRFNKNWKGLADPEPDQ